MRLIDADELLAYINEEIKQDRPDDFKIRNIKRVVEDMPTVAREIVNNGTMTIKL